MKILSFAHFSASALTAFAAIALAPAGARAEAGAPVVLWPDGAPGAAGAEEQDIPTLTPYPAPAGKPTGAAVIVFPGGGYHGLAPHEGKPIAEWLNELGINAYVLKYRLAPRYKHPSMLQDAQRAIRTVRARGKEWGVDPKRVGILGFSAGGHLVTTAGTHFDDGDPKAADAVERESSRPDAVIAIYPVVTMKDWGHSGSREGLIGNPAPPELVALLSNEDQVTDKTPPMFLVHGADDAGVAARNSMELAMSLARAKVPYELHVFEHGKHGFGIGRGVPGEPDWTDLGRKWLERQKFTGGEN